MSIVVDVEQSAGKIKKTSLTSLNKDGIILVR
jgi:hypothetical protein